MQLPILPRMSLSAQACLSEEFFLYIREPVFVLDISLQQFIGFNKAFELLLSVHHPQNDIFLHDLLKIVHENDRERLTHFLLEELPETSADSGDINIELCAGEKATQFVHVQIRRKETNGGMLVSGSLQDVTEKIKVEQLQAQNNNTLRELSFITSHELRHEYAKIQSIIQVLDKDIINEQERKELIEGARESIQIINSTIFKINHKLSFNQSDSYFKKRPYSISIRKIVIIDDDHMTNIINQRVLKTYDPKIEVDIFTQTDDALEFLKKKDGKGDYLILLDVNFPFSSGWEFLNQYEHFQVKSRVVVLSSSIDNVDRERAGTYAVVSNYITKPLSLERVKELLQ